MSKRMLTIGFCALLIALAFFMMRIAFGFEGNTINTNMPGSQFFPLLTLALIIFFSLGVIVKSLFWKDKADEKQEQAPLSQWEILRVTSVGVSGFVAYTLWNRVGFLPMAAFLILAIGLILRVRSVVSYLVLAAFATLLFFMLKSLGIPLGTP